MIVRDECVDWMQEKMFHFWFNTFFVGDEETTSLESRGGQSLVWDGASPTTTTTTKLALTRTKSDQTRLLDRKMTEQRRLRKQLNCELLNRSRRVDSGDHLNLPRSDLSPAQHGAGCIATSKSDSRLADQDPRSRLSPNSATFYDDLLTTGVDATPRQPPPAARPRTYKVLTLRKDEIDRANKDKQHRMFPANFAVSLIGKCVPYAWCLTR